MGIFKFAKAAGEKAKSTSDKDLTDGVKTMFKRYGLSDSVGKDFKVKVENGRAIVSGEVKDGELRDKLILAAGNIEGVASVKDDTRVSDETGATAPIVVKKPVTQFYVVESGDTLSKIAKAFYGNARKYDVIFEANRPMLSDPDKIYPGQMLRIPPLGK